MKIDALFSLKGRTAVVTGGGRGIGRSISEALAAAGASLMLFGRNADTLRTARDELISLYGVRVETHSVDLGNRQATEAAAAATLKMFGNVDVLFHNAGIASEGMVDDYNMEVWDRVHDTNLVSGALLTRAFVPGMKERRWGRVIYVSSAAAYRGFPSGHAIYSASKSALHGLARIAAVELGAHGITVNCIAAGAYLTDMARVGSTDAGLADQIGSLSVLKRPGLTEDMAGPALLLSSNAGSFITGSIMAVDGGYAVRA